ncbi:DNA ligase [Paenibacillus sp. CF384]|uniref:ATP-dependent DNA ligase n=1 Tax=Paenibacillus sp. CF384 TaxID=1884382 RepID=UPI00089AC0C5|nr:DNA ligase [Paenibacillus sp. CF384]SDX47015.1 bifunctional non-homologous end joining protein LigD [Paenibacillus sp. CF384]
MLFSALKPMIVSMGKEAFDNEGYIFEPKYDGWRLLIHKQGERIEAYTRYGTLVTVKFPELKEAAAAIKANSAILDCEGICMRGGRPVFDDFAYRGRLSLSARIAQATLTHPATFVVFDLIYTDRAHVHEPLMQRKERLADVVSDSQLLTKTMFVDGRGKALFAMTKEKNMEGIVAKRKDSSYQLNKTSPDWLKIKHFKSIDTVILGYRTDPFALVLGLHFRTLRNKPVGTVEFGIKPEEKQAFLALAEQLHTLQDKQTQWIEPRLCCRIDYLERTDMHQLRTTIFRGFLPDKLPEDCVWDYD